MEFSERLYMRFFIPLRYIQDDTYRVVILTKEESLLKVEILHSATLHSE